MYSLERLRSLLTFDQISFFLIAEILLRPISMDIKKYSNPNMIVNLYSIKSLRFSSVMLLKAIYKNFDTERNIKKCANYLSRTKTHHICTDTCLSFLYFSSRLTTSTYTKAKEAHNTYCVRLLTFLQKGKHQILKTVCLNIFFNTTC